MGFSDLARLCRERGARRLAVVAADEENVLKGVLRARREGIASPVLIGDRARIEAIVAADGLTLDGCEVEHVPDAKDAAERAMELVRKKSVSALMKGRITTPELMRLGLRHGLRREGRLLTHVTLFENEKLGRPALFSDGAMVPYPTYEQRVEIVRNAVEAMRALGFASPRVAILSSTEDVDEKIPVSVDAARLKAANGPGGALEGQGIVDGPLDLLAALDPEAARVKGQGGEVAGRADVLICPDVVAGNLMGKALIFFAPRTRVGGCVVGGAVPVILLSRASSADDKYCSIVLGLSCGAA
ncbi:MAG: phosphate acyltransferase [Deltaproteobacteria bacterium]|nr:phosphate acyltransferase [Deltaproteobacteria bacterium]